jgi:hypothetical protein
MKDMYNYEKGIEVSRYRYYVWYHPSIAAMRKLGLTSTFPIKLGEIKDEKILSYQEVIDKLPADVKARIESYDSGDVGIYVSFVITNHLMSGAEKIHDIATDGGVNPVEKN